MAAGHVYQELTPVGLAPGTVLEIQESSQQPIRCVSQFFQVKRLRHREVRPFPQVITQPTGGPAYLARCSHSKYLLSAVEAAIGAAGAGAKGLPRVGKPSGRGRSRLPRCRGELVPAESPHRGEGAVMLGSIGR